MLYTTNCCGIREIDGLEANPEEHEMADFLDNIVSEWFDGVGGDSSRTQGAFMFFSCTSSYSECAEMLIALIKKHKLGTVQQSLEKLNPNSDNHLTMYMWSVAKHSMLAYASKQGLLNDPVATYREAW